MVTSKSPAEGGPSPLQVALNKALQGGTSGALAMSIQVREEFNIFAIISVPICLELAVMSVMYLIAAINDALPVGDDADVDEDHDELPVSLRHNHARSHEVRRERRNNAVWLTFHDREKLALRS